MPPDERDLFAEGALANLLKCRDVYDAEAASPIVPYDAQKLRVLRGETVPKDVLGLVDGEAAEFLRHPERMVRPAADWEAEAARVQPHWDTRLAQSPTLRAELVRRPDRAGLVTYRRRARRRTGLFFV